MEQKDAKWGVVFHENSSSNSKFRSSGAELFWAPLIAPMFVFQTSNYEHDSTTLLQKLHIYI